MIFEPETIYIEEGAEDYPDFDGDGDPDIDYLPGQVNTYAYCRWETWYPQTTGGTWKRKGYIQNTRFLRADPGSDNELGGGRGVGEDDLENGAGYGGVSGGYDVDDIYYVDPTTEIYGPTGLDPTWAFISLARGARCCVMDSKSERDCSLAGGHIWQWRGWAWPSEGELSNEYQGMTWGWPTELD